MKGPKIVSQDLIRGVSVDEAAAFRAERDGKRCSFFSDRCRQTFLSRSVRCLARGQVWMLRWIKRGECGHNFRGVRPGRAIYTNERAGSCSTI